MLDRELPHGKVLRIARGETPADRERGGRDETVRLGQRPAAAREPSSPLAGLPSFGGTERHDSKSGKERTRRRVLARPEPSHRLFDVDRADVRRVAGGAKSLQPRKRTATATEQVDQDRGVEQDCGHYPTRRGSVRR